ncbi:MAG: hypothetical protein LBQ93_09200 [Treponema sp.]|jgi:hypothetical protein|nr:hypothetical protein [Treponema sp.]
MKNLLKFIGIITLAAAIGFSMTACGDSSNPDDSDDKDANGFVKFNLTGAKAILAAESSSGGRAVSGIDGGLYKVLADDSVVSLIEMSTTDNSQNTGNNNSGGANYAPGYGNNGIPRVKFIARSPVAGKKDLYICFDGNWDFWTEGYWVEGSGSKEGYWVEGERKTIGTFIHVKEDGSFVTLSGNDNNSWNNIQTDQDNDPVAFDQSGNLYFTASESSNNYNTNVIYKYNPVTEKKEQLTAAINNIYFQKVELSADGAYVVTKGYRWSNNGNVDFLRLIPTANPDIADYLFYRTNGGGSVSAFSLHPQKKELYISGSGIYNAPQSDPPTYEGGFYKISLEGTSRNDWQWTKFYGEVETFEDQEYYFHNVQTIFAAPDNSVWGIPGSSYWNNNYDNRRKAFTRLIDTDGQSDFFVPKFIKDRIVVTVKPKSTYVYLSVDVSTDGQEKGNHNIYRFPYNDSTKVQNLFQYMTSRNPEYMEVFYFDANDDFLYFGGTQGTALLTGKIDLATYKYTEFDFGQKIIAIVAY